MMEGKWWCVRHLALISLSTVAVVAQRSCPAGEKTLTIRMTAAGTTADGTTACFVDTGAGTVASCNLFANILVFAVSSASSAHNASIIASGITSPSVIGTGPGAQCLGQMNGNVCAQGTAGYTEAASPNITANYCFADGIDATIQVRLLTAFNSTSRSEAVFNVSVPHNSTSGTIRGGGGFLADFVYTWHTFGLACNTSITGNTSAPGAVNSANQPSPDHWYTITAPIVGSYTLRTCGSTFDTVISVFLFDASVQNNAGTVVGRCDDTACCCWSNGVTLSASVCGNGDEDISIRLNAGTYVVQVEGTPFGGASSGVYTLGFSCPPTPPTAAPVNMPTSSPSVAVPTFTPTSAPTSTLSPSGVPTLAPTLFPSAFPTRLPTAAPTGVPTAQPTEAPSAAPTAAPTSTPTASPTPTPSVSPTAALTTSPTASGASSTSDGSSGGGGAFMMVIIVVALCVVCALVIVAWVKQRRAQRHKSKGETMSAGGPQVMNPMYDTPPENGITKGPSSTATMRSRGGGDLSGRHRSPTSSGIRETVVPSFGNSIVALDSDNYVSAPGTAAHNNYAVIATTASGGTDDSDAYVQPVKLNPEYATTMSFDRRKAEGDYEYDTVEMSVPSNAYASDRPGAPTFLNAHGRGGGRGRGRGQGPLGSARGRGTASRGRGQMQGSHA